jgi:SAM-dependent methyltransferase
MKAYYSRRAQEYEKIYHREDPVRQGEQKRIAEQISNLFEGRSVLEVACGTGYWTSFLDQVADQIVGVDASEEVLQIARSKGLSSAEFCLGDAYDLGSVKGKYDGAVANFWFSHIQKGRIEPFLKGLHDRLDVGAVVFMADNILMDGIGGELIAKVGEADTYKIRTLEDGTTYEILKNYYDKNELTALFMPYAEDLEIEMGTCFWWLSYKVKK